jgi:hypothetical protein
VQSLRQLKRFWDTVQKHVAHRVLHLRMESHRVKIRHFKNIHKGNKILCIGAGPSLQQVDPGQIAGYPCILTNHTYPLFNGYTPRHAYHLSIDDARTLETFRLQLPWGCHYFKSFSGIGKLRLHHALLLRFKGDSTFLFPRMQQYTISGLRFRIPLHADAAFSDDLQTGYVDSGSSVIFTAIQLAAYMGASHIGLLGVDMNYGVSPQTSYAFPSVSGQQFIGANHPHISEYYRRAMLSFRLYNQLFNGGPSPRLFNLSGSNQEQTLPILDLESFLALRR